ncbi:metalloendoproteinase 3-MMP-like [Salvia miltiorrhiza]|uniref:metalloendoproteinase 3-MMP-like n=1 Tax=Salvia miltiorrhiza TaxID=226208 RepID=UPI0025AC4732|nr:metalloendoproteinase 3-MMP-like [Salvia miltiorrhiza]
MALKFIKLFSLIFLVFLFSSTISHAKRNNPSDKTPSPFDFIKQLKGCHKGNNTKGIHLLKAYLKEFGYLEYLNQTQADGDDFDDILESAVKTYQENYHIKPTGTLDATTISKMTTPRCGVPDIVNGTNYMQPRNRNHESGSSGVHVVSHYSFFEGEPKWPPSKTHLTYRFLSNFPTDAIAPVVRAFQKWGSSTRFSFARVQTNQNADLVIGFHRGDHGDGFPFDGRGGTLAHAFAPTNGRFHYDADEQWSIGPVTGAFDLETVALHEIGHLLGLGHSSVEAAIMYSGIGAGEIKNLHADDIQGIRALYNR